MDINKLLDEAKNAALKSYSPYSHFRVGCALLTNEGKIFTGTNVENRSFGGTICAERVAITKAVSEGFKVFKTICIIGLDSLEILPPCGICRQFISEFGTDIEVVMSNKNSEYKKVNIRDLLPYDSLFDLKEKL